MRMPCRLGDATLTVAPGIGRPWLSTTRPEMVPVVVCADAASAATRSAAARSTHAVRTPIPILLCWRSNLRFNYTGPFVNRLEDRKSVVQGKSVDIGGRRIIKKKKKR